MGGDSRSRSHRFESQHLILVGYLSHDSSVVKIVNVCSKKAKIIEKEDGNGPAHLTFSSDYFLHHSHSPNIHF